MEKIKILFTTFALIYCQFTYGNTFPHLETIKLTTSCQAEGFIVMEDDVMLLTSNDPNDAISRIEIFSSENEKVSDINGCFVTHCSIDLSSFSPDKYLVTVNTANENSFSAYININ